MDAAQASAATRWSDRSAGRWFYASMAIACIVFSIAAFGPSILNPVARLGSFTFIVAAHGIVFFVWLFIFLIQTLLVQTRKINIHRALGTASIFLAAVMVVLGYVTAIAMTRRGFDLSGDLGLKNDPLGPVGQIIFPLLDIFEFGILVAAGYLYRRRSDFHRRLMLFATIAMMPAPFAHFFGHSVVLRTRGGFVVIPIAISLASSAVYDFIRFRRIHPVSLWLGSALLILDVLCAAVIGPSAIWHRFADWLIR